jgi:hypothetical protein
MDTGRRFILLHHFDYNHRYGGFLYFIYYLNFREWEGGGISTGSRIFKYELGDKRCYIRETREMHIYLVSPYILQTSSNRWAISGLVQDNRRRLTLGETF